MAERLRARSLLELAASVPRLNPQKSFEQYTGPFNLLGVDYYASTGEPLPRCTMSIAARATTTRLGF